LHYVEGRNLVVKSAFASGHAERLPGVMADLLRASVEVVVTTGYRETLAVKQAAPTTPIVMTLVPDPVASGLVASLARPGGNSTGLTDLVPGLRETYVELLKSALPSASRFAVVTSPPNPQPENRRELEAAVKVFGIQ
jgi:putative tryptophan/tyrosine transport system substrate-binding protein